MQALLVENPDLEIPKEDIMPSIAGAAADKSGEK